MQVSVRACQFTAAIWMAACVAPLSQTYSGEADLHQVVLRFEADRRDVLHEYGVPHSTSAARRLEQFYRQWDNELRELDFDALPRPAKIDYLLLRNYLERAQRQLEFEDQAFQTIEPLAPFLLRSPSWRRPADVVTLSTGGRRRSNFPGSSTP